MFVTESEVTDKISTHLVQAQKEMKHAVMDAVNPHFKNKYATLKSVIESVKESLNKNQISFQQLIVVFGDRYFVKTILRHSSGQWIASYTPVLQERPGPQAFGSGLSYAKRYGLAALCGVPSDEDDDGNLAEKPKGSVSPSPAVPPKQNPRIEQIKAALKGSEWKDKDVKEFVVEVLKKKSALDLPQKEFSELVNMIKTRNPNESYAAEKLKRSYKVQSRNDDVPLFDQDFSEHFDGNA